MAWALLTFFSLQYSPLTLTLISHLLPSPCLPQRQMIQAALTPRANNSKNGGGRDKSRVMSAFAPIRVEGDKVRVSTALSRIQMKQKKRGSFLLPNATNISRKASVIEKQMSDHASFVSGLKHSDNDVQEWRMVSRPPHFGV